MPRSATYNHFYFPRASAACCLLPLLVLVLRLLQAHFAKFSCSSILMLNKI